MIDFHCTHCHQSISAADDAAGSVVACPQCGQQLQVPGSVPVAPVAVGVSPPLGTVNYAPPQGLVVPEALPEKFPTVGLTLGILATLGLSFLSAWIMSLPKSVSSETAVGRFIGAALMALIAGAIVAAMRKRSGKHFGISLARVFSIVAPSLAVLGLFGQISARRERMANERQQYGNLVSDLKSDLKEFEKVNRGESSDASFRTGKGDPTTMEGKVRNLMGGFMKDMLASQKKYEQALEEAGASRLLEVSRLMKDEDLRESREIIANCREAMKKAREEQEKMVRDLPNRAEHFFQGREKEEFVKGMMNARKESIDGVTQMWDLEFAITERWSELIDVLEANKGHWQEENGQLVFEKDETVERFNAILKHAQDIADKQTKLREAAQKKGLQKLDNLK